MQVFEDGWCQCYAGCGRFHISHYFDEFKDPNWRPEHYPTFSKLEPTMSKPIAEVSNESKANQEYTQFDLFPLWSSLPPIPRTHDFKTIPLDVLDSLGWRWSDGHHGMGSGYFIPYFNHDKSKIPFAQVRHLTGERRFTFLPGAEPIAYGKWNLEDEGRLFVVEGASDAAVLEYLMIPWIAMPSASSGKILENLAKYCQRHKISLIYAGDNDEAGDKLKAVLDSIMPYRVCQPPKEYKDWGDFLVARGVDEPTEWCWEELKEPPDSPLLASAQSVFEVQPQQPLF